MKPADIIEIVQHFQSGNPVESRPRGSAEEYKSDPKPIWDFAGREYRKGRKLPRQIWVDVSPGQRSGIWSDIQTEPGLYKYILVSGPETETIRNPENIDFKKYPIPEGYRVVTEEDIRANRGMDSRHWIFVSKSFGGWRAVKNTGWARDCTYLCPVDWRPS